MCQTVRMQVVRMMSAATCLLCRHQQHPAAEQTAPAGGATNAGAQIAGILSGSSGVLLRRAATTQTDALLLCPITQVRCMGLLASQVHSSMQYVDALVGTGDGNVRCSRFVIIPP